MIVNSKIESEIFVYVVKRWVNNVERYAPVIYSLLDLRLPRLLQ